MSAKSCDVCGYPQLSDRDSCFWCDAAERKQKARRERIAVRMMAAHTVSLNTIERDGSPVTRRTASFLASVALEYADALIAELDKEPRS